MNDRPSTLAAARTILAKDLRVELRTLQSVPAMVLFSASTFVLFRFSLDRTELQGDLAAGVLLTTVLFAGLLAINRVFVAEREQGGFEAIRLAPIDGSSLYLAKVGVLVIYMTALEVVALPLFWLFFLDGGTGLPATAGVLLTVNVGLAAVGALISSIATNSRARDLLAPLILLPLLIPLVISGAEAISPLLLGSGPDYSQAGKWLAMIGLYDLIFLMIGYAVFDFLLED